MNDGTHLLNRNKGEVRNIDLYSSNPVGTPVFAHLRLLKVAQLEVQSSDVVEGYVSSNLVSQDLGGFLIGLQCSLRGG